jgi:DNA topoisomerase-1
VSGYTLRSEFRGKSGVLHEVAVADQRLARIVQQLQDLPGHLLFKYVDERGKRQAVDSDDVNEYLRHVSRCDVTAKDFRTWSGTMVAARAMRQMGPPAGERPAPRNVNPAVDKVAPQIPNTRAVCRKYYVHPGIIEAYHRGVAVPELPRTRRGRFRPSAALRREEIAVLQFLQQEVAA